MQFSSNSIPIHTKLINPYLDMINDSWRNRFFYDALQANAKDKVVLDVGTGTGILSAYALHAGAKFVYAVEVSREHAKMADSILAKCFDRSRFKVLNCNFWTDEIDGLIDQQVDILVSELVGPGLFDQGQIHTWHCAKPFLKDSAISIPDRLHCDVYIWNHQIDIVDYHLLGIGSEFNNQNSPANFMPNESLLESFAQALINYDRDRYDTYQRFKNQTSDSIDHRWIDTKTISSTPDEIHLDVVNVGMNFLPDIYFDSNSNAFPNHIIPQLEFCLDLSKNGEKTVAIINKMSFEDNTLYIQDARFMAWKYSPTFIIPTPGLYKFKLLELNQRQIWKCELTQ